MSAAIEPEKKRIYTIIRQLQYNADIFVHATHCCFPLYSPYICMNTITSPKSTVPNKDIVMSSMLKRNKWKTTRIAFLDILVKY